MLIDVNSGLGHPLIEQGSTAGVPGVKGKAVAAERHQLSQFSGERHGPHELWSFRAWRFAELNSGRGPAHEFSNFLEM